MILSILKIQYDDALSKSIQILEERERFLLDLGRNDMMRRIKMALLVFTMMVSLLSGVFVTNEFVADDGKIYY